ncbi:hypothetical protein B0H19DRAFT_1123536 [Mycena capillaripes]|nr:hypothetical protein B0H19DRAFT_1203495 [Mycena capillaripes]KAJ6523197.1 hypothetical protein B0H19DRAFT_1202050 [Mycena capillaripes]KAJ6574033.1 hypothetical protein B0H19DRAFT_1123536 [Mycena capillaripes]
MELRQHVDVIIRGILVHVHCSWNLCGHGFLLAVQLPWGHTVHASAPAFRTQSEDRESTRCVVCFHQGRSISP